MNRTVQPEHTARSKAVHCLALTCVCACCAWAFPETAVGQVIRGGGNPYSSQLMTDPDGGTIQGIQRYGKPLAADPEQGNAYPYHVFPSVRNPRLSSPFSGSPTVRLNPFQQQQLRQEIRRIQTLRQRYSTTAEEQTKQSQAAQQAMTQFGSRALLEMFSQSMLPDPNYSATTAGRTLALAAPPSPVFNPRPKEGAKPAYVPHQPLIQIKLRVVEITRNDGLAASSTLDFIRNQGVAGTSEFDGRGVPNINNSRRNLTGASRFNITGLINVTNAATAITNTPVVPAGAGALVNLTSRQLNWIASLLASELEADVLTAPELVTTNGEGVEFVAGSNEPFTLGTVTTDPRGTPERQNHLFYKHVGTYIRVTPRIINFGAYGAGRGDAPIVASDVRDWNLLIRFLLNEGLFHAAAVSGIYPPATPEPPATPKPPEEVEAEAKKLLVVAWEPYTRTGRLVPLDVKSKVLDVINQFTRTDLRNYVLERTGADAGFRFDFYEMICRCDDGGCDWEPEDCVIDLEVLARFSTKGTGNIQDVTPGADPQDLTTTLNTESDVRAVSNILQLKAGTGLVMAGLLGESDVETVSKVPVLGDLPGVGSLFRAKSVARTKTEILIFVEAHILSQDPDIARAQSAADLHTSAPYVAAGTLDNPLEAGLHRAGFGTYLPPPTHEEEQYWERSSRRINRIKTTKHDALR